MESMQPTKTKSGSESQADLSEGSKMSGQVEATEKSGFANSSETTSADTQTASAKTLTSAELDELRTKAGLVAGALADFQAAGGLVAVKNVEYTAPSGSKLTATRLYLVAEGLNLVAVHTTDGIDFNLVAEGEQE